MYSFVKRAEADVLTGGDNSRFGKLTARRDKVKTNSWTRKDVQLNTTHKFERKPKFTSPKTDLSLDVTQ